MTGENRSFFGYFRKEQAGILILVALAIGVAIAPRLYFASTEPTEVLFSHSATAMDSLAYADSVLQKQKYGNRTYLPNFFYEKLRKSGVSEQRLRELKQYAGRNAVTIADISRISGLDSGKIRGIIIPAGREPKSAGLRYSARNKLEINSADSFDLLSLPGLGPVYVSRILRFRKSTGGFFSPEQLLEIWYIDTTTIRNLLPLMSADKDKINRLEISEGNKPALVAHPYISDKVASQLILYRRQHGKLTRSDLDQNPAIPQQVKSKLVYYLKFD